MAWPFLRGHEEYQRAKVGDMTNTMAAEKIVRQRTLKNSIQCSGTGLHSGAAISMSFRPAPPDTGIVFERTDLPKADRSIPAIWNRIVDSPMCTTIGNDAGAQVGTVEHLMAAFAGCSVDNAIVEISGAEVAIMDGSAEPFVFLIECAGFVEQGAPRRAIEMLEPISVGDAEKSASLMPGQGTTISCDIDFDSAAIARQTCTVTLANGTFKSQISRARTFGFEHEVIQLRAAGLARGGSLENAIVVSEDRILNEDGLRYENEFARHKVLDCIGDLYLAGAPIIGRFSGFRSGHAMNHQLLRHLFEHEHAWRHTHMREDGTAESSPTWQPDAVVAIA